MSSDDIIATAFVTKEFTFHDPMTEDEAYMLVTTAKASNIDCTVNQSGRSALFACDNLEDATAILAEVGLIESLGLIREITEWDISGFVDLPQYPYYTIELDNDNG